MFAATVGGGVFRSGDGGDHWQAANQGLEDLNVLSLAGDPSNANVRYAGSSTGGIFKSTDGGANWASLNVEAGGCKSFTRTNIFVIAGGSATVSPAVDTGGEDCLAGPDQRGRPRPQGDCDVGAVER